MSEASAILAIRQRVLIVVALAAIAALAWAYVVRLSPRIPEDDLPHDKYGYREYGIMLHVTEQQIQTLRKFHEAIGSRTS